MSLVVRTDSKAESENVKSNVKLKTLIKCIKSSILTIQTDVHTDEGKAKANERSGILWGGNGAVQQRGVITALMSR